MKTDPGMIDIDEETRQDDRPVEVPVFSIESASEKDMNPASGPTERKSGKDLLIFDTAVLFILAAALLFWCVRLNMGNRGVTSSVSDSENIQILKETYSPSATGTELTSDSILGVGFDMYSLTGLSASLERDLPSPDDESVVLFMRSADYHPDGSWIGTVVIDGEKFKGKDRKDRSGYVAISKGGRIVTGISGSDKVAGYAESSGGSFFRQYVILGDGELPSTFALHGKVERAAIGRMADGRLFYIVTRNKETMYDFADALREYGFTDAVYITGGNNYTFFRDKDGDAHISSNVIEKLEKYRDKEPPSPILVFRNQPIEKFQ